MFQWTGCNQSVYDHISRAVLVTALVLFMSAAQAFAGESTWKPLVERLVKEGFDRDQIQNLYSDSEMAFDPEIMARKMNSLLSTRLSKAKPGAPAKPEVMSRYLNPILIAGAYAHMRENRLVLGEIEKKFGVPAEIVVSIYLIETKLGRVMGKYKAFSVLSNMALGGDYDRIKEQISPSNLSKKDSAWLRKRTENKGNWAFAELVALLRYAQQAEVNPVQIPSSSYGAIGFCQFMPSNADYYGRDGNNDGKIDLFNEQDALASIANFLKQHGWKRGIEEKPAQKVLYRYNHSMNYVLTIQAVADRLQKTDAFFGRD